MSEENEERDDTCSGMMSDRKIRRRRGDRLAPVADEELDRRAERSELHDGDSAQRWVLGLATHLEHRQASIFPVIGHDLVADWVFALKLGVRVTVDGVAEALRAGAVAGAEIGTLLVAQSSSRDILEV